MRIIDERTGAVGDTVSTPEEALLALSGDSEQRLARGLRYVWDYVHPDDATTDGADEGDGERRSVRDAAKQRGGVLGAALGADGGRPGRLLRTWTLRFDPFTEANASEWPRAVSALRGQPALAEATLGEMAAHLNADLRGDLAALLGRCADYVAPDDDGFGRRDEAPQTVWDRFRVDNDLYHLDVGEVAAAIAARTGALGRPRRVEGRPAASTATPMRCAATRGGRCAPACSSPPLNSSPRYLAGDAELTLYRMVARLRRGAHGVHLARPAPHLLRPTKRLRRRRDAGADQKLGAPRRRPLRARPLLPGLRRRPLLRAADQATPGQRRDRPPRRERTRRRAAPSDAEGDRKRRRRRGRLRLAPLNPTHRRAGPQRRPPGAPPRRCGPPSAPTSGRCRNPRRSQR